MSKAGGMRVLIAGGGTGGHLYPGIAVAEEVTARGGEVLFVGTSRGLEARVVPAAGYALELLTVSGLKRMGPIATLRSLARLPLAFARSLAILRKFKPDVVLGVGGYASGPLVLAAALTGRPTAVQEQNSVPGITNRVLGRFARGVFIAFDPARASFPAKKIAFTGNPVRRAFVTAAAAVAASSTSAPGAPATPAMPGRLLVVGGSQGARAINDLVLGVVEAWAKRGALPQVVHQAGAADAERVSAAYARLGVGERVQVRPFIDDMVATYAAADVVLGRAGALTLAELAVVGRPAVLIPLPTAADDHQTKNAEAFAAAGAALVVPQARASAAGLDATLSLLLADGARRDAMAQAMRALGRPQAAGEIVDRLAALARRA